MRAENMIKSVLKHCGKLVIETLHQKTKDTFKYQIEYKNLEERFEDFPKIYGLEIKSNNGIILFDIFHTKEYLHIEDDIGFDKQGSFITIGWKINYDITTGKRVIEKDKNSIEVSCIIKLYTQRKTRTCYYESDGSNTKVNLIPYEMLHFKKTDSFFIID